MLAVRHLDLKFAMVSALCVTNKINEMKPVSVQQNLKTTFQTQCAVVLGMPTPSVRKGLTRWLQSPYPLIF